MRSESYSHSLNRFFTKLENIYSIKVVIASHPKAKYDANRFDGRDIHRMITAELVKDADFVITHTSTAISYAVLNLTPILFVYTEEMLNIYKDSIIKEINNLANFFKIKSLNIDRIDDDILIKKPNEKLYNCFRYTYLTSEASEKKLSEEIFWEEISKL